MKEELQFPKLAKAQPPMPLDCSDTIARMLADDVVDHERLENGRALYRRIREQIAKELIIVTTKRTMTEVDSPTPDGLSGPAKRKAPRGEDGKGLQVSEIPAPSAGEPGA